MKISKVRTFLYTAAKILGDIDALKKGPNATKRRIKNRVIGKVAAKKIFK